MGYGGNIVSLRPSLRAAIRLEALHGGFIPLLRKVQQGDTTTLREIITHSATDRTAAHDLLSALEGATLAQAQQAMMAPAFVLITALMTPDHKTDQGEAAKAPNNQPVAWAVFYADLFKMATGWLGWPPETAWNATMPEILQAFEGHVDKLKAIHGDGGSDESTTGTTPEQRQANVDAGLDPEFDRAGLSALKGLSTAREGQVI